GAWTYDAVGHDQAQHFAATHDADPAAVLGNWQDYESWHPTRRLWQAGAADQEEQRRVELAQRIRDRERDGRLAALRRAAADPAADAAASLLPVQARRGGPPRS